MPYTPKTDYAHSWLLGAQRLPVVLSARTPATHSIGIECGHHVSILAIDQLPVAYVHITGLPELSILVVGSVDHVAITSHTHWHQCAQAR